MKQQNFQWNKMTAGVCYYPEHWPRDMWANDLDRMKAAGFSTVRVAEFSWTILEPAEGQFQFGFWQEFLDLCEQKGMGVILGTPTATPPAWLTEKYPEVLNCSREGIPYRHGGRRHYTYNSPVYQKLCARIVEQMARQYAKHPAVVGWQIDNELNCERDEFYAGADHTAFRAWLREKYGTLDALNAAWGTVFWNETYTDWAQLTCPRPVPNGLYNPSMLLDYYRFISASARWFCKMQADILRKYKKPGDFITTNGLFGNLDNHSMTTESLDVYTYDSYPAFALQAEPPTNDPPGLADRAATKGLLETRSVCPHFGIMEQQSGLGMRGPAPRPGQLTLWAMQSVAQGADYVSFFRWRTCRFGTEMYWYGILDHDSRDNRKLAEAADFCQKLRTLDPVCGAENVAAFALLKDYDNVWNQRADAWLYQITAASEAEIFAAAELNHTPYDVVYLQPETALPDLARYPVLVYPHPMLMSEERAALLQAYVEQGGTLVVGCRSGNKTQHGTCTALPQPGHLQPLTGTDVQDFTFESPAEDPSFLVWNGERLDAPILNDILMPLEGTETLAHYGGSYYAGQAALTQRTLGKGRVLHLGCTFTRALAKRLFIFTGILEPFAGIIEAPQDVQVVLRQKGAQRFLFVLNYQAAPQTITLRQTAQLLYTGESVCGEITLPPYGTAVYAL